MTKAIAPLSSYLTRNPLAKTLLQKRAQQQQLLQEIRQMLPNPLVEHCLAAVREQGHLVLFVDTPVWASRMRFLAPEVARRIQGKQGPLPEVKIRVTPPSRSPSRRKPTSHGLSLSTRRLLLESAAGIADPSLRSALERLARVPTDSDPESD